MLLNPLKTRLEGSLSHYVDTLGIRSQLRVQNKVRPGYQPRPTSRKWTWICPGATLIGKRVWYCLKRYWLFDEAAWSAWPELKPVAVDDTDALTYCVLWLRHAGTGYLFCSPRPWM